MKAMRSMPPCLLRRLSRASSTATPSGLPAIFEGLVQHPRAPLSSGLPPLLALQGKLRSAMDTYIIGHDETKTGVQL